MRVLVACECSGVVRDAFAASGHDAWSCDIVPAERNHRVQHIMADVLTVLDQGWDLMIAHPPCTYLSRAGARWWKSAKRQRLAQQAFEFVMALWDAPIERVAIENPIGMLNKLWRYPDQTIQPWQFGERFSKATCLWLRNLPLLSPTNIRHDYVPFLPSNTGLGARKGQRTHRGHVHGGRDAARTFQGIARAMADQWGNLKAQEAA